MIVRLRVFVPGALCLGLIVGTAPFGNASAEGAWDSAMLALLPDFGVLCGECQNCEEPGTHELVDGEADRRYGENNHPCVYGQWSDGYCQDRHPPLAPCSGGTFAVLDEDQKNQLVATVIEGDGRELVTLVARLGEGVAYNSDREAVQVYACDGETVVLSMPVSAAQATTFAQE